MKHLLVVALPAALSSGVMQINLLVGQQVASRKPKAAVSWLFAADRLYQLPLGVVGIAVGIVLLPDLSRRLRDGDATGGRNAFSRAGEISLALTLPSAVALVVIPLPLVSVLFERGAQTADDTAAIAFATAIYGLGLPAFVLQKVLQPLYFAREDTRTPFRFALWAMVINAVLAIGLFGAARQPWLDRAGHSNHGGGLGHGLDADARGPADGRCGPVRRPLPPPAVAHRAGLRRDGRGALGGEPDARAADRGPGLALPRASDPDRCRHGQLFPGRPDPGRLCPA